LWFFAVKMHRSPDSFREQRMQRFVSFLEIKNAPRSRELSGAENAEVFSIVCFVVFFVCFVVQLFHKDL